MRRGVTVDEQNPGRVARWRTKGSRWVDDRRDDPVLGFGLRLFERDRDDAGSLVGSAIAFRLFLFFVPFLLFVVGVAGFAGSEVDATTVNENTGLSGEVADQVRAALRQSGRTRWIAVSLGLLGVVTAGRALSKALIAASSRSWRIPVVTRAPIRLVGSLAGLITSMGLIAIVVGRIRNAWGLGAGSISFLAAFIWYAAAWFLISLLLPRATRDPSVLVPGALVVALTITGMQAVSQFYLPNRFENASELYGTIGATIVTLGWFFILGRGISLAFSVDAEACASYGSLSHFIFSLPGLRSVARRSARIRRLFDLG